MTQPIFLSAVEKSEDEFCKYLIPLACEVIAVINKKVPSINMHECPNSEVLQPKALPLVHALGCFCELRILY